MDVLTESKKSINNYKNEHTKLLTNIKKLEEEINEKNKIIEKIFNLPKSTFE